MNIKNISSGLFTIISLGCVTLFSSCSEDLEVRIPINKDAYNGIYENNAYLRDAKSNLASNVIELYKESYTTSVRMGLSKVPTATTTAKATIDPDYLKVYNKEHNTDFELYPQELVSFGNEGMLVANVNTKSADVEMTIQAGSELVEDKTYAIPVTITNQSQDITVGNEKSKYCMYLVRDMRNLGDAYKGEDKPKGFLFFEVNDVNPLNAFAFQLENGKMLWDAVVLFAANINYDGEAGRPRIQCNPNVQYLLDNNEIYLQPLRKRGIKVILGLLGNHDITGLAQLSKQGAKDFAREVAQYCRAYNLDGVNYDNEWSEAPDLNNPALAPVSVEAAARLCYESKQAMPDKLVTVFAYAGMYGGVSSVDGVDIDNWIDVTVPNYTASVQPLGKMSWKKCAGLSMELNLGLGNSLNERWADILIDRGYGWFMGFAPSPAKYPYQFQRFSGVQKLYGSLLKSPFIYYKKNDPHPYPYVASDFDDE